MLDLNSETNKTTVHDVVVVVVDDDDDGGGDGDDDDDDAADDDDDYDDDYDNDSECPHPSTFMIKFSLVSRPVLRDMPR